MRAAIQQPLRAAYPEGDKRFQSELVERLAQDAAEDAAYLPLLQVTLEEIWRKGTLTIGSYTNLTDAIKQRADKVLAYQDYNDAQPDQPRTPDEQAAILNCASIWSTSRWTMKRGGTCAAAVRKTNLPAARLSGRG